ncbi:MAG: methyltransferase domain-containing protein [Chloroflexi bacterium]|nr:methyltransferase domain-containing protein [Chloroflexota bacterium]
MASYDDKYRQEGYYWGVRPSALCYRVLALMPPERPLRLLDIGCGEGRNAVFFARNGYQVTAFDLSPVGVEKTRRMAREVGVSLEAFTADLLEFRLEEPFDIFFSTGTLHFVPEELRAELLDHYKQFTRPGGLHAFSVFVRKPFIAEAPDADEGTRLWISGELFTHYHDWKIEFCTEEIFDCTSGGIPHQHAVNRILARKILA